MVDTARPLFSQSQSTRSQHQPNYLALLLTLALSLASCGNATRRYSIAGQIVSIDQEKKQIILNHGDIPGYMPAMVMPFSVKDANQLSSLARGDEITATLTVGARESWLDSIKITRKSNGDPDQRDTEIRALPHEGDAVPDFTLVNQSGRRISLADYRGKVLVITFIYTRCPLPDYCPLMSSNFAEIDRALGSEPALYNKIHLLSVSFDARYDTPAVLRSYGAAYTERYADEKFDHWEFASGSEEEIKAITKFFGLQYSENSDQIVHSLVTAVITPAGKVNKIHASNDWKPAEVVSELRQLVQ
jgi:protein SCO1/2